MMQVISAVVIAALAIFVGFYLSYYAVCLRFIRNNIHKKRTNNGSANLPVVSVIVPVYNEANVLERRIENLEKLVYPKNKLEIIFVDGGSDDGGAELLKQFSEKMNIPNKVILQGQRSGFNNAVREGFAQTTGDIICVTGAETEYDPEAIDVMVQHFIDPKIGAVTGKQRIKNADEGFSPKLEIAYRDLYDFVREAESCIDSPFDIKGEISAARRDIVKALTENPKLSHKGCIDACFSFQARTEGYKTVYEPDAVYYELSPRSMRDSFKQQIRRAATLIENMLAFKNMTFNRRFGAFGMLIMPAHFLMLVVLPYLFLFASIGMIVLAALNSSNYLALLIVALGLLAIVFSSKIQAFVKTQLALTIATLRLLKGVETQKFERLQSTRPDNQSK